MSARAEYTLTQTADLLGISRATLTRWIRARRIEVICYTSRCKRITSAAIMKFQERSTRKAV
jgi:predicted site-specific integrase-resolvase